MLSHYKIKRHKELYGLWNPDPCTGPSTLKKSKFEQKDDTGVQTVDSDDHCSDEDVKSYGPSSSQSDNECNVSILWDEPEDTSALVEVSFYSHLPQKRSPKQFQCSGTMEVRTFNVNENCFENQIVCEMWGKITVFD